MFPQAHLSMTMSPQSILVHNSEIAAVLNKLGDLLEIEGENEFRVRAYRNAARAIDGHPRSIAGLIREGSDLSELPGIGKSMAQKIEEVVKTGRLQQLAELEQKLPGQLAEMMNLATLGPKRVKTLHTQLHIDSLDQLERAARQHEICQLPGLGEKTEQKILDELARKKGVEQRAWLIHAEEIAEPLVDYLKESEGVKQVVVAGSYRRRKETVGDLDILATCKKGSPVADRFVEYPEVEEVISHGSTRCSVRLRSGLNVDLRVVAEVSYGAALHYFTGSKAHNIAVRKLGVNKGLKINEYGVFKGQRRVAGRSEEEVYAKVGLPHIEPELREGRGEVEAAQEDRLPELITLDDLQGDLHCHTKATDGRYTIEEMAEAAREIGHNYIAITDHSKSLSVAQGLDEKRLAKQIREIDRLADKIRGIRVLKGIECDILEDGSLDLDDAILKELDVVVCSLHSKFKLSREKQTERVLRAMDNPNFHILAHPTGRMIGKREAYDIDLERVMKAARQRGCLLEVSAQPERLDLSDVHAKLAKEIGVRLAISTDAHRTSDFRYIRYGVEQARRGWIEADDVVNTRSWDDLKRLLKGRG